jgi:hypothetical protein
VDGVFIEALPTGDDAVPLDCSEAVEFGQELLLKIQEVIYELEGSLNKMMIDDKGQVINCFYFRNIFFVPFFSTFAFRHILHYCIPLFRLSSCPCLLVSWPHTHTLISSLVSHFSTFLSPRAVATHTPT